MSVTHLKMQRCSCTKGCVNGRCRCFKDKKACTQCNCRNCSNRICHGKGAITFYAKVTPSIDSDEEGIHAFLEDLDNTGDMDAFIDAVFGGEPRTGPYRYVNSLEEQSLTPKRLAQELDNETVATSKKLKTEGTQSNWGKEEAPTPSTNSSCTTKTNQPQQNVFPFWNDDASRISDLLMLPTNVVSKTSTNDLPRDKRSWFTTENKTFSSDILPHAANWQAIVQEINKMVDEEEKQKELEKNSKRKKPKKKKKVPAEKAKKIKLRPTPEQREKLKRWMGTARWTYNRCLAKMKSEKLPINVETKKALRAEIIHNSNYQEENQWVLETPYQVRDEALCDLMKAFESSFAAGHENFTMKFRSKKNDLESIAIESRVWKKQTFYRKFFGEDKLKASEVLPEKIDYDFRIVKNRLGEFFICIPLPLEVRSENQAPVIPNPVDGIVAIDPGVRTFCSCYSPSGETFEWGKADIGRLYRLCRAADKLQSRWSQNGVLHRQRYRLQRAARRIRKKIRDLVDEVHKKFTKWIVTNYRTVLLPRFNTQRMVRRADRRIGSKTARSMLTWAHYRFRVRLLNKVREHPWCKVVICDEAYTSKTCGSCGKINAKLGASKLFRCPHCNVSMDRDINGARNILIRFLTLKCKTRARLRSVLGLTSPGLGWCVGTHIPSL